MYTCANIKNKIDIDAIIQFYIENKLNTTKYSYLRYIFFLQKKRT